MITGSAIKDLEIGHTRCSGNDSPRLAVLALGGDSLFLWKLNFSSIPVTATSSLACRGGDRFWFRFVLRFTIRGASSLLDRGSWNILCCCDSDITSPKLIAHERNTVLYVQSKVSPRGMLASLPTRTALQSIHEAQQKHAEIRWQPPRRLQFLFVSKKSPETDGGVSHHHQRRRSFNCIGPPAHSRQLSPIMLQSPKTSIRRRRLSSWKNRVHATRAHFFLALPGITANVTEVSTEDMPFPKVVDNDHFHDAHASKIPSLRDPGSSLRKTLFYRRILSKMMTTNRPIVHRTDKSILPTIGKVCQQIQPIIVGDWRRWPPTVRSFIERTK